MSTGSTSLTMSAIATREAHGVVLDLLVAGVCTSMKPSCAHRPS
jgi:hypothetical protein